MHFMQLPDRAGVSPFSLWVIVLLAQSVGRVYAAFGVCLKTKAVHI